jgi:hypothetical protein
MRRRSRRRGADGQCCRAGLGSAGLALDDLGEVGEGEDDAAAVEVERDLLAVGAGLQRAFGDRGQAVGAQNFRCCGGSEDLRQAGLP